MANPILSRSPTANAAQGTESRIPLVICAVFLVVGVFVVVSTWAAYFADVGIEQSGVVAEGIVLKKEIVRSTDGDSDYRLAYRFPLPSGEMVQSERNVPKQIWTNLRSGAPVVISYSAEDPRRNFPVGGGMTSLYAPILVSIVFGGLAAFGGLILLRVYRPRAVDVA